MLLLLLFEMVLVAVLMRQLSLHNGVKVSFPDKKNTGCKWRSAFLCRLDEIHQLNRNENKRILTSSRLKNNSEQKLFPTYFHTETCSCFKLISLWTKASSFLTKWFVWLVLNKLEKRRKGCWYTTFIRCVTQQVESIIPLAKYMEFSSVRNRFFTSETKSILFKR